MFASPKSAHQAIEFLAINFKLNELPDKILIILTTSGRFRILVSVHAWRGIWHNNIYLYGRESLTAESSYTQNGNGNDEKSAREAK